MTDAVQYITPEKKGELEAELRDLHENKAMELAKRIDDARQMGDLSENAEYHAAREEMAWVQSRIREIEAVLQHATIITDESSAGGVVRVGSTIIVEFHGKKKEYMIVGAQEADPLSGKISNESPLGEAFLGKKKGDSVQVSVPAGIQVYKIIDVK